MPKPPMNDTVTILKPILGDDGKPIKDDHGRFQFNPVNSKARVQHTTKVIGDSDGQQHQALLSVDFPPETEIGYGYDLQWNDRFNQIIKGTVLSIDETLNYTGNKVYFRSVNIGQKGRIHKY
jgi:hypothetical protein